MFLDLDLYVIAIILLSISIGGFVKGIISFGFPLVALPILSLVLPIKSAIFLLFFSLIIINAREIKIKKIGENIKKYHLLHWVYFWELFLEVLFFIKLIINLLVK